MNYYTGQIILGGWTFAPRGSYFCEGQSLPIQTFTMLYSLIGLTFGGDGRSTFNLPDMRGRTAIQYGQGPGLPPYSRGQFGGLAKVTLQPENLPPHAHTIQVYGGILTGAAKSSTSDPVGNFLGASSSTDPLYRTSGTSDQLGGAEGIKVEVSGGGYGDPIEILNPSLVLSYCMVFNGIFPPRS